jgi:hypothetical protein
MTVKIPLSFLVNEKDKKELILENYYKQKIKLETELKNIEEEIYKSEETLKTFKNAIKILSRSKE